MTVVVTDLALGEVLVTNAKTRARIMRFDGSADGPHAVAFAPGVIAVSEMMFAARPARVRIWRMPK